MKVIYAANARIPSEKAHAYQIVQMCEAFADQGTEVILLYASRRNPPPFATDDIWTHYAVEHNFRAERLPCIDLYPLAARLPGSRWWERLAAALQVTTYNLSLVIRLFPERDANLYSRDPFSLFVISLLWPRRAQRTLYEAHTFPTSRAGLWLRRQLAARISGFVVITEHLRQRYADMPGSPHRIVVAHDGIRLARFQINGSREHWRRRIGWPEAAFIVGYMGRFYGGLEQMDRGLDTLLNAVTGVAQEVDRPVRLALVGGPSERVDGMREVVQSRELPDDFILYPGQVPPADVPGYLRAFDVCAIPSPWTEFYAYYTSPMKLFEYMASGSPLVASDLPTTAEIVCDGENGLLVPPGDVSALQNALRRLYNDPELARGLADRAAQDVLHYTWDVRARRILDFIHHSQAGESEG